jgi:hypothetical protein
MKASIAIWFLLAQTSYAVETLCFTAQTSALFADGKNLTIQIEQTSDETIKISTQDSIGYYRKTEDVLTATQSQRICRQRIENLMQARAMTQFMALKENNPLSAILLLTMGLAPINSSDCRLLQEMTYYKADYSGHQVPPLGTMIGRSSEANGTLIFEDTRGLIYQAFGCGSIRRHR